MPGWAPFFKNVFYFLFFSILMLKYFKLVIWSYENGKKKNQFLTFYIDSCSKSVGVGLNLALLKDN